MSDKHTIYLASSLSFEGCTGMPLVDSRKRKEAIQPTFPTMKA